ncbi:MAG: rare lipoprotein A [Paraglaciecola sp.]|jgi:rare lipoprotein A
MNKLLFATILMMLVSACTHTPVSRYQQRHDSAPTVVKVGISLDDAVPKYEPYAPANQRGYHVMGRSYTPLKTGQGYSATGGASWYGQKFHGHLTSNGERYDMYTMSAAHKTLPLPSYVRVTNLANAKQVVVRVNDRGPFHDARLIDLSYAAALKLGMLRSGSTQVKIDVIHVDKNGALTVGAGPTIDPPGLPIVKPLSNPIYIQVTALQDKLKLKKIADGLASLYQISYMAPFEKGLYRLQLGPFSNDEHAEGMLSELRKSGYTDAYIPK